MGRIGLPATTLDSGQRSSPSSEQDGACLHWQVVSLDGVLHRPVWGVERLPANPLDAAAGAAEGGGEMIDPAEIRAIVKS